MNNNFVRQQRNRIIFVLILRTIYMVFLGGVLYRGLFILERKGAFKLPFGMLLLTILVTFIAVIASAVQYAVKEYRELSESYGAPQVGQNKGCGLRIFSLVLLLFITGSFAVYGYSTIYDLVDRSPNIFTDAVITKVSGENSNFKLIPFGNKETYYTYEFDYYYSGKDYTAVCESKENFEVGESISVFINPDYPEKVEIYNADNEDNKVPKILFVIFGWIITLRLFFPDVWNSDSDNDSSDYDDD